MSWCGEAAGKVRSSLVAGTAGGLQFSGLDQLASMVPVHEELAARLEVVHRVRRRHALAVGHDRAHLQEEDRL